jgi:hypothetical protein
VKGVSGRHQLVKAARGFIVRRCLIATCASLILAMMGTAFAPTKAQAALACSFNASGSPIGTQLTGQMTSPPLQSCYFGYTGAGTDFGFTGFSTQNIQDFSGSSPYDDLHRDSDRPDHADRADLVQDV